MRELIIFIIPEDTGSGFLAVAGILIGLALLVGAITGAFPWIVTPLFWLVYVAEEVTWGWLAVVAFVALLMASQFFIGRDESQISPVKLAMIAAFLLGLVLLVAATAVDKVFVKSVWEWLLLPVVAAIMGFMFFPMVYAVTAATALVVLPWSRNYALRGACCFISFVGLLLALQAAGELVCGKVLDMVRLDFTGRFLLLDVSDNASLMDFGSRVAEVLIQMGAGMRLLLFGGIGALALWGEIALKE